MSLVKERDDLDLLPVDDDEFTPAAPQGDRPRHRRLLEVSAAALTASAAFLIAGALFYGFGNETTTRGSNQVFAPGQSVALSLRYATVNLGWGEGLFLLGSALLVGWTVTGYRAMARPCRDSAEGF